MIIELTSANLDKILPIGKAFAAEANYPGGFSLDALRVGWVPLLDMGLGTVFAIEDRGEVVAALGMAFLPDMFSGRATAIEQFWYVQPKYRHTRFGLDLFYAFEAAGKARNVKKLVLVHLAALTPAKLQAFYESRGYVLVEQTFWKELA